MIQERTGFTEEKEKKKVFKMEKLDNTVVEKALKKYSKAKGQDRERVKEAISNLLNGNIRFVNSAPLQRDLPSEARKTAGGQQPFAALVLCSDSRSPETAIFDAGIGEIFVIRVAGTVPGKEGLASLEYAVSHLHVPLIGIVGHDRCGAVTAAFQNAEESGSLGGLLESIRKNIKGASNVDEAIKQNTKEVRASLIAYSDIISSAYASGKLAIVPLHYHMAGNLEVEIL